MSSWQIDSIFKQQNKNFNIYIKFVDLKLEFIKYFAIEKYINTRKKKPIKKKKWIPLYTKTGPKNNPLYTILVSPYTQRLNEIHHHEVSQDDLDKVICVAYNKLKIPQLLIFHDVHFQYYLNAWPNHQLESSIN